MRKILKRFVIALLTISIFAGRGFVVLADSAADDQISPYYNNCYGCSCTFAVTDTGEAHVNVTYHAINDAFSEARVTVKIQKRFLGIFWKTVDIGLPNNEWIDTSTDINGVFYNSFDVDGTGTYRAIFTVEIIGIDGSVDVIEDTIESKYS
jgi:hypothetical protein